MYPGLKGIVGIGAKIAASNRGRKRSSEMRARMSASARDRKYSPEGLAKMSAAARQRWRNMRAKGIIRAYPKPSCECWDLQEMSGSNAYSKIQSNNCGGCGLISPGLTLVEQPQSIPFESSIRSQ